MGTSRLYLPKFPGPLDQYKKAVQLRSLLGRQQLNQQFLQSNKLKLQQAQQQQQAQERVDQIIAKHKGDLRAALPEIMQVSPRSGRELQTWLTNWERQSTQKKLEVLDLSIKKTNRRAQLASGVRDQASYEAAINRGRQEDLYDEPTAQQMLSVPYNPKNVRAIQRQALTSQQWFSLEQNRLNTERQQQQDVRNAPDKVYDFLARTMGTVRSQSEWTAKRNFAQARLRKMGVSEDYLDLIPEQYSPQAAQQMKELGIAPREERREKPPSAAGKALAERTKQRAMERAEKEYSKNISAIEKDWEDMEESPEKGGKRTWFNAKARKTISNDEMLALRKQAEDELSDAKEQADESYLYQIEALGFQPGQPVDYRSRAGANGGAPSRATTRTTGRTTTRQESAEGRTAINPETGEKVVYRGGKWVPVPK